MLMLRERGKQVKQGTKNGKLWEHGNTGQFWMGTRTSLGDPQLCHVPFAFNIERKGSADLMVYSFRFNSKESSFITFIFSKFIPRCSLFLSF